MAEDRPLVTGDSAPPDRVGPDDVVPPARTGASAPKGRPPQLFPLFAAVETLPGIGPKAAESLATMGVTRPRDLILTLPHAGVTRRTVGRLADLRAPEIATVTVTIGRHQPPASRGRPWRIVCSDDSGDLTVVFFNARAEWVQAQLPTGQRRVLSGKVELFDGLAQMVHPDHILREGEPLPPRSSRFIRSPGRSPRS